MVDHNGKKDCRKVRLTRVAALLALAEIRAKKKPGKRAECRVYCCPTCRAWHLTSRPTWR